MKIRIGCVLFTPHGFDVTAAYIRWRYNGSVSELDRLIITLCEAGF